MALLKRRGTNETFRLAARYRVGRSPSSHLCLTNRLASNTHAEIHWNGSTWEIRDLGSSNHTFVGGHRLKGGEQVTLLRGVRLAFGDPSEIYEFIDDSPPGAAAVSDSGDRQEEEDGILVLPSAEAPVLTIFDPGGGTWVAEGDDGSRRRISNGETLSVIGERWQVELPEVLEATWQPGSARMVLHSLTLRFAVSRDEEHVEVSALQGGHVVELPARAHNYMLLTLARERQRDRQDGASEANAGWIHVEDLLDMLQISEGALNVAICRARRDMARAEVFGATGLIERQAGGTRRLRLGVQNIDILST
ncbi:FHA domain-containing protein [Haliangium ochraceum]|uniref:FHA domain containing protein n=1 Tax=Haliangium ochraceum (strain DSM 14365 / JCM 11303 / SMP-2) TaxID=502025 RepID=D0LSI7_HALO1|nr:FHA domain-containing protein [Haliangium ochraceum]ACY15686.1 FHA domain containing protein [Haliangium ochraceum DSM 14365]